MIRKLLIAVVILVFAALAVLGGTLWWVKRAMDVPQEHAKADTYIKIEKGSAPAAVIGKLVSEGVIADGTPVMLYLRLWGDASKIKAGDYKFPSPISPLQVLAELEKGEERVTRLTIPEGFTIFDISKRIADFVNKNPPEQSGTVDRGSPIIWTDQDVLALMNDTSQISDIDAEAKNLEGYMYPATYDFPPGTQPQAIIKQMVEQFRKVWKPEWTEAAKAKGLTPHQVVTIASLIETESKYPQERAVVASVIFNRLSKGMALGIDQTNVYIAKMEGRWDGTINQSDLDANSPYNTRKRAGLPPGPISGVTVSSIEAALNPATTDYIFYVLDVQKNDGSHLFFASAADFERAKADYQKWLEQQRAERRANEAANTNSN
ncbi:MAG TPA: endolytic transglycosylase MltG [Pyrinomonadaceae bacterium]|nr:endolytic transglycosylase MltG [Pyrinomonadaceae bacterium]